MTANKKSITKNSKSPAPATKSAASKSTAKKKSIVALAPEPTAATPAAATIAAPAAVSVTPTLAALASTPVAPPKPVASKLAMTTITARVDVGFGNALYLRGEGPGLSWDRGVAMECVADDQWVLALPEATRPLAFKFLINDVTWSTGPDYNVASGTSVTLAPSF